MKNVAIIAEFNPFHNGHSYMIEQLKAQKNPDCIVIVMSGNFVQRGDLAIIDKWRRAFCAIQAGANLVIELPAPFANQNAQMFSEGAFGILSKLNIDHLCFGTESSDLSSIIRTAKMINCESKEQSDHLNYLLKKGHSYPKALATVFGDLAEDVLTKPNNTLAVEYLKAMTKFSPEMKPYNIHRIGADYHSKHVRENFSSATAIRASCFSGELKNIAGNVPSYSFDVLKDFFSIYAKFNSFDHLFNALKYRILTATPEELSHIYDVTEGIENRLIKLISSHTSLNGFLSALKTKRYTHLRLRRILLNTLLLLNQETFNTLDPTEIQHAKILAFDQAGRSFIKENRNQIYFISKQSDYKHFKPTRTDAFIRDFTNFSSRLYYFALNSNSINQELIINPYMKKDGF